MLPVISRTISNQLVDVVEKGFRFNNANTEPTTGDESFETLVIFVQLVVQFCCIVSTEISRTKRYLVRVICPGINLSHKIFSAVIVKKSRT